mmetsp:Transcript_6828/g.27952  ORF Transcript_6828/g.27952 Transcript_6828/m.27952 type:complete len:204 (+) Transcript_6828:1238-1849(+)
MQRRHSLRSLPLPTRLPRRPTQPQKPQRRHRLPERLRGRQREADPGPEQAKPRPQPQPQRQALRSHRHRPEQRQLKARARAPPARRHLRGLPRGRRPLRCLPRPRPGLTPPLCQEPHRLRPRQQQQQRERQAAPATRAQALTARATTADRPGLQRTRGALLRSPGALTAAFPATHRAQSVGGAPAMRRSSTRRRSCPMTWRRP